MLHSRLCCFVVSRTHAAASLGFERAAPGDTIDLCLQFIHSFIHSSPCLYAVSESALAAAAPQHGLTRNKRMKELSVVAAASTMANVKLEPR